MIIGFPKAVTVYCVKLPFGISKINTDNDQQDESSLLCPVHATEGTNTFSNYFEGREWKGRREENMMGEGETQRWGGTTNPSNSLRDASMDGYEII